jgi:hypothetical protein
MRNAVAASGQLACVLLLAATTVSAGAQTAPSPAPGGPAESVSELVRDVVYNETHDREHDSHWEYRSERITPDQNVVREQVETTSGPVFRVIEQNGAPLDASRQRQEERRLDEYVNDPAAVAAAARAHQEDEDRLNAAMQMLPQALLFDYVSEPTGDVVRLAFHPNPAFVPNTYEARVVHALTGTVTVDTRLKRMIAMQGTVADRVNFGYGIFGHVEKGGSFSIHRRQVSATHWKTDLVEVHIRGKVLLLKTFSQDQSETRTDFHPVPGGTTLAEAKQMLNEAAGESVQARLAPAAMEPK